MKKIFLSLSMSFLIVSCTNTIKSEAKFELPKYAVSEENFTSIIKDADSSKVGYKYEAKTNLLYSSSANKLVVEVYFNKENNFDRDFIQDQFDQIKKNAEKEILNLSAYDILEVQFFNNKIKIKSFENIIKI